MITIVLPISRSHFLKRVFTALEFLECDREQTRLLVYVDGTYALYQQALKLTMAAKFIHWKCLYRAKGPANVSSIFRRRQRIADIHNELKENVETKYVFSIEDDTIVPPNALTQLMDVSSQHSKNAGIVTGVELGRWGYLHIGAWKVNDVYEPSKIESVHLEPTIQAVDSCGLYCCVVRSELYKKHTFAPFQNALGPDFNFGLTLRQEGYTNFMVPGVRCTHMTLKEDIPVDERKISTVTLTKGAENWSLTELKVII